MKLTVCARMRPLSKRISGFSLIESLVTIAIIVIISSSFFLAFLMIVRLERAVTEHEFATAALLEFDRTWRRDIHGAKEVSVTARATDDAFTTTVAISYPSADGRSACYYEMIANEKGETKIVRRVWAVATQHSVPTILLSNVQQVSYVYHPSNAVHELSFVIKSGFDAYRFRDGVRILASANLPPLKPNWKEVHR